MKLITKLALTSTLSKAAVVLLFVILLPLLINRVAFQSTNRLLRQQEKKVFDNIREKGLDYYLQGDSSYGSYTLLKEEYVSLEKTNAFGPEDTILTAQRIIENDTLTYRILNRIFTYNNQVYQLEIGKTIESVSRINSPLQRIALYVLAGLIILTLLIDLLFTKILLRPLSTIIRNKIIGASFPFKENQTPVKTSTTDFAYLDESLRTLMSRVNENFNREREFTSNASHELMTPVSILQTKLENMLLLYTLEPAAEEKVMEMMKTLRRLKKIIDSLLLISRIENDQYLRKSSIHPAKLVAGVLEELQHRIEDKELTVTVSLQPERVLHEMNEDLIFQLFYNIIHNAIRYNQPGGAIAIRDKQSSTGSYAISIEDTGPGIAPEDVPTIFDRFRKKSNLDGESNGLGLAIVKSIAGFHHITLQVDARPGGGTVFTISFPH